MRKKESRLAWDQEKPGALPGCPTIFLPTGVEGAREVLTLDGVEPYNDGQPFYCQQVLKQHGWL